uniref:Uncharacterized protein n=1 Tax=Clandestinovirus TaxID=2831644 RepID=A0A8F8PK99_9VIRU|nr:hypothetical protein KOM_12_277 [Clandestinovirus]
MAETVWLKGMDFVDNQTVGVTAFDEVLDRWIVSKTQKQQKSSVVEEDVSKLPGIIKDACQLSMTSPTVHTRSLLKVHEMSVLEMAESLSNTTIKTYLVEFLLPDNHEYTNLDDMSRVELIAAVWKWRAINKS